MANNSLLMDRSGRWAATGLILVAACTGVPACRAESGLPVQRSVVAPQPRAADGRGLVLAGPEVSDGYILFSPLLSTTTFLIDREGRVVHIWESSLPPGASVYLLDNGHLLRCARHPEMPVFFGGGQGGRIQEFDWDGELIWDFVLAGRDALQHHDIEPLPNGNVLAIAWQRKSRGEAIRAGRRPELVPTGGLLPDCVVEIEPQPPRGGRVVWRWQVWDHFIQDHDPEQENFGVVADHPELVDINGDRRPHELGAEVLERLKALGYLAAGARPEDLRADFMHSNSIHYNPGLDQIVLSVNHYHEVWVIDHSTTMRQAAGSSGGRAGRGGDLLYRWGNPEVYGRGAADEQRFFGQHDARWIPPGMPGAGNLLVFNNGAGRSGTDFSSIEEIAPPLGEDGRYELRPGEAWGPADAVWRYTARPKSSFRADFISSAHRLPKGNTFVCSGPDGRFFEITPEGKIVWEYRNPFTGDAPNPAGDPPYSVFRATWMPPDHPAVADRRLEPLDSQ